MNDEHLRLCASAEWAAMARDDLLPWVLGDDDLGDDVLELGAGPGLVTDLLVERAPQITAIEIDERLAAALRMRMARRPVRIVTATRRRCHCPTAPSPRRPASRCCTTSQGRTCRSALSPTPAA